MRTTVYCAISLDGFIARMDGDVSWLGDPSDSGDDDGFAALMDSIDYLVMGRNTFETVLAFGVWPYEQPVLVLTHRKLDLPDKLINKVEAVAGTPCEVVAALADRGAKHLYVDGGKTIQSFLAAGLIQDMTITTVPVLIGSGIPLFGKLEDDIHFRHIETRILNRGLVQNRYQTVSLKSSG